MISLDATITTTATIMTCACGRLSCVSLAGVHYQPFASEGRNLEKTCRSLDTLDTTTTPAMTTCARGRGSHVSWARFRRENIGHTKQQQIWPELSALGRDVPHARCRMMTKHVWEFKRYFYPSAGGLQKPKCTTRAVQHHDTRTIASR